MILKRNSIHAAILFVMVMTVMDLLASLPGLGDDTVGGHRVASGLWSPAIVFPILVCMLPAPPRAKRGAKKPWLVVAAVFAVFIPMALAPPAYFRAIADAGVLAMSVGLFRRVPSQDVHIPEQHARAR